MQNKAQTEKKSKEKKLHYICDHHGDSEKFIFSTKRKLL